MYNNTTDVNVHQNCGDFVRTIVCVANFTFLYLLIKVSGWGRLIALNLIELGILILFIYWFVLSFKNLPLCW